ncbi:ABC transporter ATP-binding protein, partial [Acinetobacter sp. AS5]|uniref:ABC transporter ATP-binding protein n=1 Tax=Acinetobacter sp. AS5 TaxID=3029187 RepID=UPI003B823417
KYRNKNNSKEDFKYLKPILQMRTRPNHLFKTIRGRSVPDIPLLQFIQLTKHFKNKTLFENLDYQLFGCGLYTLVGVNGAGKSTLLAMIAGMEPLSSGEIRVNGYSSRQKRHIAAQLAFVPDHTMAYPFITGRESLDFIASVRHLTPHSYSELIDDFTLTSF